METIKKINKTLALPLVWSIKLYQATISPDHGFTKVYYPHGFCRFYPSCSEYAKINLEQTGVTTIPKIVYRIIRCNPFNPGGIDLPRKEVQA